MDIQDKTKIKQAIKGMVNSSGTQSGFILEENGTNKGYNAAMSKTEMTITVSWSGGGQIKAVCWDESDEKEEFENDKTDEDKAVKKVLLQSLYAPGLEFSFMEDEKNEFSTDEAQKKFEGFWVGLPVGGASGDFFNDGRHVAGVVDRADYPVLIEIQMIPHQDNATLVGWIKTHYKCFCLSSGNLDSPSAGNIRLELTEGEHVVGVRMLKIQEGSGTLIGIVFIELTTSKARVVSVGSSNGLRIANSLPDKHT
ncbi:hypothetical protein FCIRC_13234 [Fusarium circinatum]|uniref:Uncharacterized protein n=1 Tax=Fusarium circinatum TaxID=48490 RepID=A0A8H5WGQ9_FUSCI|nr:hypothetical protein FCIRC_13234 [Fusarium circinatum]